MINQSLIALPLNSNYMYRSANRDGKCLCLVERDHLLTVHRRVGINIRATVVSVLAEGFLAPDFEMSTVARNWLAGAKGELL